MKNLVCPEFKKLSVISLLLLPSFNKGSDVLVSSKEGSLPDVLQSQLFSVFTFGTESVHCWTDSNSWVTLEDKPAELTGFWISDWYLPCPSSSIMTFGILAPKGSVTEGLAIDGSETDTSKTAGSETEGPGAVVQELMGPELMVPKPIVLKMMVMHLMSPVTAVALFQSFFKE